MGLFVVGIVSTGIWFLLAQVGDPLSHIATILALYLAAFAAYVIGIFLVTAGDRNNDGRKKNFSILSWVILVAVLSRTPLLLRPPLLSSDLYRYVWDGRMTNLGVNPYRHAPDDPQVARWRDPLWQHINFKQYSTIYPPVSQAVFALAYRLNPASTFGFKWVFFCFDMGTMLFLLLMLRRMGRPLAHVLLYAWNPLVILEIAGSGHQDILAVFFLVFALWAGGSGISLALSAMSKGYSLLLTPLMGRGNWKFWLGFCCMLIISTLPFVGAGAQVFGGLRAYTTHWQGNHSLFGLIEFTCRQFTIRPLLSAKCISAVILIGIVILQSRRAWKGDSPTDPVEIMRSGLIVLLWFFFLSPTVYPWYLVCLVPLLVFVPPPGAILFTGLCVLDYTHYLRHTQLEWVRWAEYVPVFGLLLWEWRKNVNRNSCPCMGVRHSSSPRTSGSSGR